MKGQRKMKNKENKVIKEKSKSDKKQVVSKIFAFVYTFFKIFLHSSIIMLIHK